MSQMTALTMPTSDEQHRGLRIAIAQVLVLTVLWLLLIRHEYSFLTMRIFGDSEAAHALAAPLLIGLLIYRRWDLLAQNLRPGSLWGLVLIGLALIMFSVFTWPFFVGYPRQAAIVPAVAGFILAVGGWRVLKLSVPMLIILLLMVPIGWRQYAFLIIHPETYTFLVAEQVLSLLPGVFVTMDGPDIYFNRGAESGTIALGDPHRGASLFPAMAMIGAFVTFAKIRPFWQIIAVGVVTGPILLLCNFLRLFAHSVITIYGGFDPLSAMPRMLAGVTAIVLAYFMFTGVLGICNNLVTPAEQSQEKEQ